MSSTVFGVGFDAQDAHATATFWAEVLGRIVADAGDIDNAAIDAEIERLTALGASTLNEVKAGGHWTTLAGPRRQRVRRHRRLTGALPAGRGRHPAAVST